MEQDIKNLFDKLAVKMDKMIISMIRDRYDRIVDRGGPEPKDYTIMSAFIRNLFETGQREAFQKLFIEPYREWTKVDRWLMKGRTFYSLMLHIYDKPSGYAGDYNLLKKLYQIQEIEAYSKEGVQQTTFVACNWDKFISSTPECIALQSRKWMFTQTMQNVIPELAKEKSSNEPLRILDLGCGHGDYLKTLIDICRSLGVRYKMYGVDIDPESAQLANESIDDDNVSIVCGDVLRAVGKSQNFDGKIDVVYSMGLFDYFSDKLFGVMLKNIGYLKPRLTMIGNMEHDAASRAFMHTLNWELEERSPQQLSELAGVDLTKDTHAIVGSDFTHRQHILIIERKPDEST